MSDKVIRISDYTNLDAEFIKKCREAILKLEGFVDRYVKAHELDPLEQLLELENIKRQHGAELSYFMRFYSPVSSFRENHEFMSNERKGLKSRCIDELTKSGNNSTTAERLVYDSNTYKEGISSIQDIKKFFIYVWETYQLHSQVISRSIHQSISTLQKELENLKRS